MKHRNKWNEMLLGTEGGGKSNQRWLEDGKKCICERLIFMIHLEYPELAEVQNLDFSNFFYAKGAKGDKIPGSSH